MEDLFLKSFEYGALGFISIILLTKGMSAIKDLSDSVKSFADVVAKLSDKVNLMDNRVLGFEYELRNISNRLDKIEAALRGDKNANIHQSRS